MAALLTTMPKWQKGAPRQRSPALTRRARALAGLLIKAGVQMIAPNGETIDGAAIIRTIVVLILLVVGYVSAHRLKRNLLPLGLITAVFAGSLLFLPWAWGGAPS